MTPQKLLLPLILASVALAQPETLITGLQGPQKIILTPRGNLLVSETSTATFSGRISVVSRQGTRRSLFEGLPSGTEVTGGGSGPSAMALRERTLYFAMGGGDVERSGPRPGTSIHNPAGPSSPLFSLIFEARFTDDIDNVTGTFRPTVQNLTALHDGAEVELSDGAGGRVRLSILMRFPQYEPDPVAINRFSNPWGLALSADGRTIFATDASSNSLVRIDTQTGRWRRVVRFPPLPNPIPGGAPVFDAVPTSVRIYGDSLLVSFLTGFPFVPGYARVMQVNPETGAMDPFIFGLTSSTDILWRERPNGSSQFFITEFSVNQSAAPAPPGRLLRFDTPVQQVAVPVMITPTSMAYDPATNDLFILELRGQIQRLRLE